jgi:hypothetical protein
MRSRSQRKRGPAKSKQLYRAANAADDWSASDKSDDETPQTKSVRHRSAKRALPLFDDFFPDAATRKIPNDDA